MRSLVCVGVMPNPDLDASTCIYYITVFLEFVYTSGFDRDVVMSVMH